MAADEDKQRQLLDEAGETLMRLARDRQAVSGDEIDRAMAVLAEIEQHPASNGLGKEAATKLDQLNRTRSTPSGFVR